MLSHELHSARNSFHLRSMSPMGEEEEMETTSLISISKESGHKHDSPLFQLRRGSGEGRPSEILVVTSSTEARRPDRRPVAGEEVHVIVKEMC